MWLAVACSRCVCVLLPTGNTANQIISALKRHYMFFTSRWIESFHLHFTPFLYLRQMVEEFLEQLRGNNDFLKLLGGIVTDQDFRCQNEELLKIMYRKCLLV